ncbi:hypothetical protein IQ247_04510 [Plectonema cf. radiosum LEGE 06105]|uniref:Uncharacterized protein n=1 Tax=Plectonema cf. radiosum LEGE 06105 TaxID=945769 RepID=A0A8J7F5X8_9CYAN|nr:hypothetical protein [Plectonema radiosum]MBE9211984.1 hypothetical protein [Plectonema cf. radiosum LEGE 06105]
MTQQIILDELQIHSLKIGDIIFYLHLNGWQIIIHPNPRLLVFQSANDDEENPIKLVLPSQNTFEDSNRLLIKAINLLAVIEEKSPQEIIDLVSQLDTSF